jgi:hypothetical protein
VATELFRVRLDEAIAEVERELVVRGRFYAERVRTGGMSRLRAASQIGRLEAARDFLIELKATKGGDYEHTPGGSGALAG